MINALIRLEEVSSTSAVIKLLWKDFVWRCFYIVGTLNIWEGNLQGVALLHKTYAARLMGGEAAAPDLITSILRFMVDLAKMCHPFTLACKRMEFLESVVDLYFACAR